MQDVEVGGPGRARRLRDSRAVGVESRARLEFAVANREKLKIDIINLSLGHPIYESPATDPLVLAVEDATRAGIIVVAASGNHGMNQETGAIGYAGITSPGNAPSAITVGALDMHDTVDRADDTVAPYSSRGPAWYSGVAKPDLVAPGHKLVAIGAFRGSLYERYAERRVWGREKEKKARYLRLSGSSMATAVTSGVVALMVEANHERYKARLTPNAVKAILEYTALPVPGEHALAQGMGGLNGAGAVLLADSIDPGRPIGAWWLTSGVQPWTVIDGQSFPWSQSIIWGNRIAAGEVVFANRLAWEETVIWGTDDSDTVIWGTTDDDTVIWGTTDVVWDDPSVWSQTVIWGTGLLGTVDGSGYLSRDTVIWGTIDPTR